MNIIAVIPARMASTRLPRKILREIAGRPMLAWVYEATRRCAGLGDVIVATDSDEIYSVCEKNGWHVRMTSPDARSGTERVHEVANQIAADVYVNVQGDEPLARQEHLDALVALMQDASIQVGTLKTPMPDGQRRHSQSECRESGDGFEAAGALLFASDHSLRSRSRPARSATSSTWVFTRIASRRWISL